MFEQKFLGQVRVVGMGQSQAPAAGAPAPASSDARFSVPAVDQNFVPMSMAPFTVPFVSGWAYPPQYPPGRFDCVLNADSSAWICTPKVAGPVIVGPPYPVVPIGTFY